MKCPGQDTQYWTAGAIFEVPCPGCGAIVEFFKDDTSRKCSRCGQRFINPAMDFGCASYCSYAEQCLGDLPPELVAQKEDLFKDRVAVAVKRHLKSDFKAIGRAVRRARYAEAIGKAEQANLPVVLMASYLWELDDPQAIPEVPTARALLSALKAPEPLIARVCQVLAAEQRRSPSGSLSDQAAAELAVVMDADGIVALEDRSKLEIPDRELIHARIDGQWLTRTGRLQAQKVLQEKISPLSAEANGGKHAGNS